MEIYGPVITASAVLVRLWRRGLRPWVKILLNEQAHAKGDRNRQIQYSSRLQELLQATLRDETSWEVVTCRQFPSFSINLWNRHRGRDWQAFYNFHAYHVKGTLFLVIKSPTIRHLNRVFRLASPASLTTSQVLLSIISNLPIIFFRFDSIPLTRNERWEMVER